MSSLPTGCWTGCLHRSLLQNKHKFTLCGKGNHLKYLSYRTSGPGTVPWWAGTLCSGYRCSMLGSTRSCSSRGCCRTSADTGWQSCRGGCQRSSPSHAHRHGATCMRRDRWLKKSIVKKEYFFFSFVLWKRKEISVDIWEMDGKMG